MAGIAAVRAGPRHEDAPDSLGVLYVLSPQDVLGNQISRHFGLVFLRANIVQRVLTSVANLRVCDCPPDRIRSVAGYGVAELSSLVRDLRLEHLDRAYRHINDAIDVSPTRSRSIYWNLIFEGFLREAEVSGGVSNGVQSDRVRGVQRRNVIKLSLGPSKLSKFGQLRVVSTTRSHRGVTGNPRRFGPSR